MQPLVFAKVASWNVGRFEFAILIDLVNKVQIPNTYVLIHCLLQYWEKDDYK